MELKPYPQEHAARLRDPGDFIADSFRRKNITKGIDIIIGKLKSSDGSMVTQAYRFDRTVFSAAEAKKWLKDRNVKYILFEEATGKALQPSRGLPYLTKGLRSELGLKDVDQKTGTIVAYAASFNVQDEGNDIIRPGAFKRTIAAWGPEGANRVAHLYQHNRNAILGKPSVLKEDEFGLLFESKVAPTSWGKDVLVLYENKLINEHSIGYDTITEKINREENNRELLELRLWDVSSVTWGMNQFTPTVAVKDGEGLTRCLDEFENINRALRRSLSDDTAHDLEARLRQLKQAFIDLEEALQRGPEPDSTREDLHPLEGLDEVAKKLREQTERMQRILKG